MKTHFNPDAPALTFYGPGLLTMPVGFVAAKTQGQQVQASRDAFTFGEVKSTVAL